MKGKTAKSFDTVAFFKVSGKNGSHDIGATKRLMQKVREGKTQIE